jgi:alanine dehydrogenase
MRGKERTPVVVTETMVEHMKKVIVDVSIDIPAVALKLK